MTNNGLYFKEFECVFHDFPGKKTCTRTISNDSSSLSSLFCILNTENVLSFSNFVLGGPAIWRRLGCRVASLALVAFAVDLATLFYIVLDGRGNEVFLLVMSLFLASYVLFTPPSRLLRSLLKAERRRWLPRKSQADGCNSGWSSFLPPSSPLSLFFFSSLFSSLSISHWPWHLNLVLACPAKPCVSFVSMSEGLGSVSISPFTPRTVGDALFLVAGRTKYHLPQKTPTQLSRSYSWIVWFTQVWTRLDASNRVKAPQIRYHIIPAFINISLLFFPVLCLFWKRKRRSQWRVITLAAPTSESTGLLTTEVANEDIRALTADRRLRLRRPTLLRCVVAMCR